MALAAETSNLVPDRNNAGFAKKLFNRGLTSLIGFYQRVNQNDRFIGTNPVLRSGMQLLTGQPSTSEWTKRETLRQEDLLNELAAMGAALMFISDVRMGITPDHHLIVRPPKLPAKVHLNLNNGNSHVEVAADINPTQAVGLAIQGVMHLGRSVAVSYYDWLKYSYRGNNRKPGDIQALDFEISEKDEDGNTYTYNTKDDNWNFRSRDDNIDVTLKE